MRGLGCLHNVFHRRGAVQATRPPDSLPKDAKPPLPPELTQAEQNAIDGAWEKAQREGTPNVVINDNFTVRVVSGPATRGMTVQIAGETFTLPDDTELGGLIVTSDPKYNIIRGGSVAQVSTSTGEFQILEGSRSDFHILFDVFGDEKFRGITNELEGGNCPGGTDSGGGDDIPCPDDSAPRKSPPPPGGILGGDPGPTGNTGTGATD